MTLDKFGCERVRARVFHVGVQGGGLLGRQQDGRGIEQRSCAQKVPLRTVVVVGANVDVGSALWYIFVELMKGGGTEQARVRCARDMVDSRQDGPTLQNSTIYFKHVCIENKTLIIPMRRSKRIVSVRNKSKRKE